MDRATGRLRGGKTYPDAAEHPRRPFTQYGNGFFDETQVYAGGGYAVVYANPRGSSGYAEAWGRAIMGPASSGRLGLGRLRGPDGRRRHGARALRLHRPERLGVLGGSYGGYMTSWIVSHTNRFKAAISERAVNNLVSMYGSSDVGWVFKGYHGDFVHDAVDKYLEISPWTYAKQIETPLLILHSENDLRCNIEQAECSSRRCGCWARSRAGALPGREPRADAVGNPTACSASSSCSSGSTASSSVVR